MQDKKLLDDFHKEADELTQLVKSCKDSLLTVDLLHKQLKAINDALEQAKNSNDVLAVKGFLTSACRNASAYASHQTSWMKFAESAAKSLEDRAFKLTNSNTKRGGTSKRHIGRSDPNPHMNETKEEPVTTQPTSDIPDSIEANVVIKPSTIAPISIADLLNPEEVIPVAKKIKTDVNEQEEGSARTRGSFNPLLNFATASTSNSVSFSDSLKGKLQDIVDKNYNGSKANANLQCFEKML